MYLSKLIVSNFRSINYTEINFNKGKNIIVGRNNSGKSNIIRAIDLILGESSPTYARSENITEIDFFTWKEKDPQGNEVLKISDELFIYAELKREEDEELNWDELYNTYGYKVLAKVIGWEGRRPKKDYLRISHNKEINDLIQEIFQKNPDEEDTMYINPKERIDRTLEKELDNKYIFAYALFARRTDSGKIHKDIRFLYRENEEEDWILAFTAPIRNEFLQSAVIPSFRDPTQQLKLNRWSWYGKLMKNLTDNSEKYSDLVAAFNSVRKVADEIFKNVKEKVSDSAFEIAFPNTEISFQFNADVKADIYKNIVIYIDDGFKSLLTEKGAGVQSATIIGLFSYYTNYINKKTCALLCVEEPELFLHPHACRVVSKRLDDFLDGNRNQVIMTTHNPEFLKSSGTDINVIMVRKIDGRTEARSLNLKKYRDILLGNNQNELFFADKVIVCEGFDEYVIRWIADYEFPGSLNENNVTIVNAGGKDNLGKFVKLATELGIDTYVIADFDYLLRDKDQDKIKEIENQYDIRIKHHENINSLGEEFFKNRLGLDEGKKIFAQINRFRDYVKNKSPYHFYTAKRLEDLAELTSENNYRKFRNLLQNLRRKGICILTGEIEHFSKIDEISADEGKKLNMDKIFKINSKLNNGTSIKDIFEIDEILEFIKSVLESK